MSKSKKRLIVDEQSSVAVLFSWQDKEHSTEVEHDGKMVQVNGWQFGQECQ